MNYITHTRVAFARLAAESTATPHHISLYVALFQQWNAAFFPSSILLMRDELMDAAHLGSRHTYLACLRDLTTWGFITYQPSKSHHRHSRALMHELNEANPQGNSASSERTTWSTSGPCDGPCDAQGVDHEVSPIIKTVVDEANGLNFLDAASATAKNQVSFSAFSDKSAENQYSPQFPRNDSKEKVAPKRKVRSRTPAQERPVKRSEVPFSESDLADLDTFIAAFAGTDFALANLRFYHQKVANWRKDGEPPRRRDWKATAKTFMLNDVERNALVLAPGTQRGYPGATPHPADSGEYPPEYVSQRYS